MRKKKKIIVIVALIISFTAAITWFVLMGVHSFQSKNIEKIVIENHIFYAEIVSSKEDVEKGLGNRKNLCDSCAMLFEFSQSGEYPFWMKDMHFPLDIIWIKNGEVVHIEKNISENFTDILYPSVDSDSVLEINAGNVDKLKIKIGDKVLKNYQ